MNGYNIWCRNPGCESRPIALRSNWDYHQQTVFRSTNRLKTKNTKLLNEALSASKRICIDIESFQIFYDRLSVADKELSAVQEEFELFIPIEA